MLDSEGSLRISNDNGFSFFLCIASELLTFTHMMNLMTKVTILVNTLTSQDLQANAQILIYKIQKNELMFYPAIYATSNYDSLDFEYFENSTKNAYIYVHDGPVKFEFKGENIEASRLQFYYCPEEYTYGIQFTHDVNGVDVARTFYLTMNDETLLIE